MMNEKNPIKRFQRSLAKAEAKGTPLANAMSVATASVKGSPSVRMMLLKGADARGFVFYTNVKSRKGRELLENKNVSLCFWWPALEEQVRIEGKAKRVSAREADAYFQTRPRGSQIGAWASRQSGVLSSRRELLSQFEKLKKRFQGMRVPRPPFWQGFRVTPKRIEFWHGMPDRLHERTLYLRSGRTWKVKLLYP